MNQQTSPAGRTLAALCAFVFLGMGSASATPLTPAAVGGQVSFNFPPGLNFTTFGPFSLAGPSGSVRFTSSAAPAPFLLADATIIPFAFGRASGTLVYEMEILGPAGDVPVAITVSGGVDGNSEDVSVDLFAGFAMTSVWSFEAVNLGVLISEEGIRTPALTGAFSQSFNQIHSLVLTTNRVYRVTMTADAGVRAGSALAFIDPIFSFGAGVGPGYSFQFSDGIGNSPVPEPASLALMAAGMIAIGLRGRRSHSKLLPTLVRAYCRLRVVRPGGLEDLTPDELVIRESTFPTAP